MNRNNSAMFQCEKVKYFPMDKCNCTSQGACLIAPVCIHCVCPNSNLLVIVEVFIKDKLYSRKFKKIFTGSPKSDKCNCHEYDKTIDSLFIDNFKFYFIEIYNPEYIRVEVNTQYLYDC